MAVYTVHVPKMTDNAAALEQARFVREGFSSGAFFFGPLWFLAHRLWLAALVWVIAYFLLALASLGLPLTGDATLLIAFLIELFVGLEANNVRRLRLPERGYRLVDIVAGRNRDDAEHGFFMRRHGGNAAARPQPQTSGTAAGWGEDIVGLFPGAEG